MDRWMNGWMNENEFLEDLKKKIPRVGINLKINFVKLQQKKNEGKN